MPGDIWKVLEKLAVIGGVAGLVAVIVAVGKELAKYNIGHAIEKAIPTLGWVTLGMFIVSAVSVVATAIFEHDSKREMLGLMAFGAAFAAVPLAILFIWSIHTLGWFGFAYLACGLLTSPFFIALRWAPTCPKDDCKKRAPHGARFCPYCGTALAAALA
jgi:hypothetical protein